MLHFNLQQKLPFAPLFLALSVAGCGKASTTPRTVEPRQGTQAASAASIIDLDDRPFDLWPSDEQSAATVIVFTRTDCPISNRYAPTINQLYATYEPRGVRFFLVYLDPAQQPEEIRRHLQGFAYPCPAVRDPRHALVAETGAKVTPEAAVFDARREIVYRGRIDDLYAALGQSRDEPTTHELADALDAVLSGNAVAQASTTAVGCPIVDLR
jgi:hypothetical protein